MVMLGARAELPGTSSGRRTGGDARPETPPARLRSFLAPGGPHALVIRVFLSRGLDRLPSLPANQSHRYQNHSASRARSLAHPPRPHLPDRDRPPLNNSHPLALALPSALAVRFLALLAGSGPHRRRHSFRRLG